MFSLIWLYTLSCEGDNSWLFVWLIPNEFFFWIVFNSEVSMINSFGIVAVDIWGEAYQNSLLHLYFSSSLFIWFIRSLTITWILYFLVSFMWNIFIHWRLIIANSDWLSSCFSISFYLVIKIKIYLKMRILEAFEISLCSNSF